MLFGETELCVNLGIDSRCLKFEMVRKHLRLARIGC